MKGVLDKEVIQYFKDEFEQIEANTPANWGKMNAAKMLQHLNKSLDIIFTNKPVKRMFLGRILGKIILKKALKDTKLSKNAPTAPSFVADSDVNFIDEKNIWLKKLDKLAAMNESDLEGKIHPFFGKMTGNEWNLLIYKHLIHHLKQFEIKK